MYKILFLTALLGLSLARPLEGKCDNPNLQQNFNASAYMGKWYEMYRDEESPFQKDQECVTAEYTLNPDMTITVHNSGYLLNETRKDDIMGKAHCDGAQCYVKFYEW